MKPSRASARRKEHLDDLHDALDAAKPSCGDAQLSQKEFNAFMKVVVLFIIRGKVRSTSPPRYNAGHGEDH